MPQLSPNSPQLKGLLSPVPHHNLSTGFHPRPLRWQRSGTPVPREGWQWGKHKETHAGVGKAGETPLDRRLLLIRKQPSGWGSSRDSLRVTAPRLSPPKIPGKRQSKGSEAPAQPQPSPSTSPLHQKGMNCQLSGSTWLKRSFPALNAPCPGGATGATGQVVLLQPVSHHPDTP